MATKGKGAYSPKMALATALKRAANKHNEEAGRAAAKILEGVSNRVPKRVGKAR